MRLIDADVLQAHLNEWSRKLHAGVYRNDAIIMDVLTSLYEYIADMPYIDAEPVVRCKDCVYYRPEPYGDVMMCYEFANGYWPHPDDYCSRGKRKEVEVQDEI